MTDWNGDGKQDLTDSFIDYQVYKEVSGGEPSEGLGWLGWLLLGLGLLVVLILSV